MSPRRCRLANGTNDWITKEDVAVLFRRIKGPVSDKSLNDLVNNDFVRDDVIDNFFHILKTHSRTSRGTKQFQYFDPLWFDVFTRNQGAFQERISEWIDEEGLGLINMFPICIKKHWIGVYHILGESALNLFDPLVNFLNMTTLRRSKVLEYVKSFFPEYNLQRTTVLRQENGRDCGVFLMLGTYKLVMKRVECPSQIDVDTVRPVIKDVLTTQSLVPLEKWWSKLCQPKINIPPSIKSALRSQKTKETKLDLIKKRSDHVNGTNGSTSNKVKKRSSKELNNDTTEVLNGVKKIKRDKKKSY